MKAAKCGRKPPRAVWSWKFESGNTYGIDAVKALRQMSKSMLLSAGMARFREAFIEGSENDGPGAEYYERRAYLYEQEAKRIEGLPRRAVVKQLRVNSAAGGKATAEKYARPALDDLILACLKRGQKTRDFSKAWAAEFKVSADVVERHIRDVKELLAGKP